MEIPPSSSFAQSTSLFSGESKEDVYRSILLQAPASDHNSLTNSSDRSVAISATGPLKDFKFDDFRYAYQMMNGPPKYPFQGIAQIENYKFDPWYFDGSENQPNINVNENLIGTPLGTSVLEDPRMTYVKNMMILRENQGQADQLNDSYIKELYMLNSDKGSNYYQNMLERQQEGLDYWSREGRKRKNAPIPGIAFTYNLPHGETQRTKKNVRVAQTIYSATPSVQRNYRQERMNQLPLDPNDTVSSIGLGIRGLLDGSDMSTLSFDSSSVTYPSTVASRNTDLASRNTDLASHRSREEVSLSGATRLIPLPTGPQIQQDETISLGNEITPAPRTPFYDADESVQSSNATSASSRRRSASNGTVSSESARSEPMVNWLPLEPDASDWASVESNISGQSNRYGTTTRLPRRSLTGRKARKEALNRVNSLSAQKREIIYNDGNLTTTPVAAENNTAFRESFLSEETRRLRDSSISWVSDFLAGNRRDSDRGMTANSDDLGVFNRLSGTSTEPGSPFQSQSQRSSLDSATTQSPASWRGFFNADEESIASSVNSKGTFHVGRNLGKYVRIRKKAKLTPGQNQILNAIEERFGHGKLYFETEKTNLSRPIRTLNKIYKQAVASDDPVGNTETFGFRLQIMKSARGG